MITDRMVDERRSKPVCVIDDDPSVRDSLSVLLEIHGFDVLIYGSGPDFLGDERGRRAGCLIVDHHMPEMDGLDTIDAVQSGGVVVPTILITGRLDANIAARAAKSGVIAILEKPFATARLLDMVRNSVDGPR